MPTYAGHEPGPDALTLFTDDGESIPYAGTSGWSGSDTSQERAEREDADGTTSALDAAVLDQLTIEGIDGLTWHDLSRLLDVHHGKSSAALSRLHKAHRIARLTERRGYPGSVKQSEIYVLLDNVNDREQSKYKPNVSRAQVVTLCDDLLECIDKGALIEARIILNGTRKKFSA
jgi:hypothetical protein